MMFVSGGSKGSRGIITVGDGSTSFGFDSGVFGSLSSDSFLFNGTKATIFRLLSTSTIDLRLELIQTGGDPGQDVFSKIVIERGNGSVQEYDSSAASYFFFAGPGAAQWQWGAGSSPVYQSGHVAQTHPFAIVL